MAKTIDEIKKSLATKQVPLVVLDSKWHHLFPDKAKTSEIKKLEKNLNELLKKQGQINTDIKAMKKIKAQLMQDIIDVADLDAPQDAKEKKLDQTKKLLMDSNKKLEELEDEALDIPNLIKEANIALVTESVDVCYKHIHKNYNDIKVLNKWIDDMRIELKKRILIKQDKEAKNSEIYTYMHDLLGPEVMEVFDEKSN